MKDSKNAVTFPRMRDGITGEYETDWEEYFSQLEQEEFESDNWED